VVDGVVEIDTSRLRALQLTHSSVCVSLGLFDGQFLVDPSKKEEPVMHSHVTAVFSLPFPGDRELGTVGSLKYLSSSGGLGSGGMDPYRLEEAVSICRDNAEQIVQSLKWSK
jgi:exosome complex RNA-binding protein Rrp42 (RNase PH superfamily)